MANTYVKNFIHVVFHTKDKCVLMLASDLDRIHGYIGGIVRGLGGEAIQVGGMTDHVHMLVSLPKTMSLADFMRKIKAESSKWVKTLDAHYSQFAWQAGYGAFSVSTSLEQKVIAYIRNQAEHHKVRTFMEEYQLFLKANGIEYDERFL